MLIALVAKAAAGPGSADSSASRTVSDEAKARRSHASALRAIWWGVALAVAASLATARAP